MAQNNIYSVILLLDNEFSGPDKCVINWYTIKIQARRYLFFVNFNNFFNFFNQDFFTEKVIEFNSNPAAIFNAPDLHSGNVGNRIREDGNSRNRIFRRFFISTYFNEEYYKVINLFQRML